MKARILIDDFPHTLMPFECLDYSSKIVLGSMFEPIFYEENGIFKSNIVMEEVRDLQVCFIIKEFYWSNGIRFSAKDVQNTLLFIIGQNTKFSNYLNFIEGVNDYFDGICSLDDIGIMAIGENRFVFNMRYRYDYKSLFSAIQFSPMYIENSSVNLNIFSGPFKLKKICDDKVVLEKNNNYNNLNIDIDELIFHKENNMYLALEQYEREEVSMTSSTFFPFDRIKLYENSDEFYLSNSNIEFNIILLNTKLFKFKGNLHKYLFSKIINNPELVTGINLNNKVYFEDTVDIDKIILNKDIFRIKILYPDYYPNNIIVDLICIFFKQFDIYVESTGLILEDFIKTLNIKNNSYDIILRLFSPIIANELEYMISYINNFESKYVDKYIDLLNKYINNEHSDQKHSIQKLLDKYISQYSNRIPLAKVKHIYLKDKSLSRYIIDKNDLPRFI